MIKELLVKHRITFFDKGENYQVRCLNPEHSDNNPSMYIHKGTGKFICFSCGIKGGYGKLLTLLGETPKSTTILDAKVNMLKNKLGNLFNIETNDELLRPESAVYHPGPYRGISSETLRRFKVFISNDEEFHGRVWVPIYERGKLIGFIGRADIPNLQPKYKFKPPHLKLKHIIFGIDSVPDKTVTIVEGILDMLSLRDKGFEDACCIFGVSFSREKVNTLLHYDIQVVNIMLDGDDPGRKGAQRAAEMIRKFAPNILVNILYVPFGSDPADLDKETLYSVYQGYNYE